MVKMTHIFRITFWHNLCSLCYITVQYNLCSFWDNSCTASQCDTLCAHFDTSCVQQHNL